MKKTIATVTCEPIGGDWYKVQFNRKGQDSLVRIEIKTVTDSLGGARIAGVASYHGDGE